jgi:predicted nucleotidyltransferase
VPVPVELDRERIDAVVQAVSDRLRGDWLLVGGALVALWLEPRRVTEDVDLIGIDGTGADRFALLGLAIDLGLPVEALNSAADFFVHRIADWRQHLEIFRTGAMGRIFRPSTTLFLLLKAGRLSEQDLDDCLSLLHRAQDGRISVDAARVAGMLDGLPPPADSEVEDRRARLREAVRALGRA